MRPMIISVIIPVYNAAPYLKACLDSVFAAAKTLEMKVSGEGDRRNDPPAVEVICIDDGSTDGSGALLDAYGHDHDQQPATRDQQPATNSPHLRIRVIHQANAGVSAARNAGMALATGDFITFLDSDDTYDPRTLEILIGVARKTGAEVVRFGCNLVSDHAHDVAFTGEPTFAEVDLNKLTESPLRRSALGSCSMISARLAKIVSWPDMTHCEDPLFILRCMKASHKNVFVNDKLWNYLIRPTSASHSVSLNVIVATCRYLVLAYDECAAMPGFPLSRADTCSFLSGFLNGPLATCGKDVAASDRAAAEAAVAEAWEQLCARDEFFRICARKRTKSRFGRWFARRWGIMRKHFRKVWA